MTTLSTKKRKTNSVRNKLYEVYKFKHNYNTAEEIPLIIINKT